MEMMFDGGVMLAVGGALTFALAAILFVFIKNTGPSQSYEEALAQRMKLAEVEDTKKKKEKPKKDKKKQRSATPTLSQPQSVSSSEKEVSSSSVASTNSVAATSSAASTAAPVVTPEQTQPIKATQKPVVSSEVKPHVHDHVDFNDKKQIKVIDADQPPMVESGKILNLSGKQPIKPILIHHNGIDTNAANNLSPSKSKADDKFLLRSNSFTESRPMDEVELHHKKQQQASPNKTAGKAAPTAMVAPLSIASGDKLDKTKQQEKSEKPSSPSKKAALNAKKLSPQHEIIKKETHRKIFTKKDFKELAHQIEQNELPPDMGEDILQRLVDALLNYQNESKEWKSNRQDPMQVLRKTLADKEQYISNIDSQLAATLEHSSKLNVELNQWKSRFQQANLALQGVESKHKDELARAHTQQKSAFSRFEQQINDLEVLNQQLKSKVISLESMNAEFQNTLRRNDEKTAGEKQALEQAASSKVEQIRCEATEARAQLEKAHKDLSVINEQLEQSKRVAQDLAEAKHALENKVAIGEAEISRLSAEVLTVRRSLESATKELTEARSASGDLTRLAQEKNKLQEDLVQANARNEQMHKKNWTAMEALNGAEKKYIDLKTKIEEDTATLRKNLIAALPKSLASSVNENDSEQFLATFSSVLKKQFKELSDITAQYDAVKKDAELLKIRLDEALEEIATMKENAASTSSSAGEEMEELVEEISRLKKERSGLKSENDNYTKVLAQTEEMLQNLQSSVESEEKKWTEDRARFEAERKDLSGSVRELEKKLRELQKQLEQSEAAKAATQDQVDETQAQLESLMQQHAECQKQQEKESVVEDRLNGDNSAVGAEVATNGDVDKELPTQVTQSPPSPSPSTTQPQANGHDSSEPMKNVGENKQAIIETNQQPSSNAKPKKKKAKKVR